MVEKVTRGDRLVAEIELLQAMYPGLEWNEQRQEVKYVASTGSSLVVRVPDDYPGSGHPILISALHSDKSDLRDLAKSRIEILALPSDEEVLDAIIQAFDETVLMHDEAILTTEVSPSENSKNEAVKYKTVIIWLHHLLNTNKRKLALNPTTDSSRIVGITKPGYPGVLVYSGSADAVDAHVAELKDQRWQAFQVRYAETLPTTWSFGNATGIKEVETMSAMVQEIESKENQTVFLRAVGVK